MEPAFSVERVSGPVVSTAVHAGHHLRPAIASRIQLGDGERFREEDPFTERLAVTGGSTVVVHRSRFEVDLNRPREGAVYRTPDDAWGLDLWAEPLPEPEIEQSLDLYDRFYDEVGALLDERAAHGPFVVLDLHSYNHRRGGPGAPPAPASENPQLNLGTGSLDRDQWGRAVDTFIGRMRDQQVAGSHLDVRENIRFRGGHFPGWVNRRYRGRGCALALEFKKMFMDEWTGVPDDEHLRELAEALAAAMPEVVDAVATCSQEVQPS
jgi:N-formylglutamate deformylase